MRIQAQQTLTQQKFLVLHGHQGHTEEQLKRFAEAVDADVKNGLTLSIARFLEPYLIVEKELGDYTETRKTELHVLSTKQVHEISEILESLVVLQSNDLGTTEEKIARIRGIFNADSLEY